MNPNKALWEKGDFTQIAAFTRQSGEALVKSLEITTPLKAVDLGCGDGTTAIPLARLGAEAIGIDIAKNLASVPNVCIRSHRRSVPSPAGDQARRSWWQR